MTLGDLFSEHLGVTFSLAIDMTLEVDAPSAEEAILQVIEKYRVEQIVVESNEGTKVDFFVSKVEV